MKAAGDLPCARRAFPDTLGVEAAAVTADGFNSGMALEPIRGRLRRAAFQHVRNRTALEIHDDRPVGEAFAPPPVVDRNGAQRLGFATLAEVELELQKD